MRTILMAIALTAAACGGGSKKPATGPTGTGSGSAAVVAAPRLEIAEISIASNGTTLFVHGDGSMEAVNGDQRQPLGTLTSDGKFTSIDGEVGQLQDDGSFVLKEGPAPFKLVDEKLVVGADSFTIDANNVIQGGKVDLTRVKLTGVTNRGTRRTALLMLGMLTLAQ